MKPAQHILAYCIDLGNTYWPCHANNIIATKIEWACDYDLHIFSDTVKWETVDYMYLFCDKPFVYIAGDPEKVVSYNTLWPKQWQVELLFHLL